MVAFLASIIPVLLLPVTRVESEMNMDNSTETKQESSPGKLESLAKDADLKAEMEKAKEWIKTNPLPVGKSEIR